MSNTRRGETGSRRRWTCVLAMTSVCLALAASFQAEPGSARVIAPNPSSLPNVLLIVVDDQGKDTQHAMPNLLNRVAAKGVTFSNGIAPTALCCPSRSALLTGNHSHTTGVWGNDPASLGGWPALHPHESQTIATALDAAGYHTGLFGKYVNAFHKLRPPGYIPPGWDTFRAILGANGGDGAYYDYRLTGLRKLFGAEPLDYSTDVTGRLAVRHIQNTPAGTPWFIYYSPFGVHSPMTPAPRHEGTWPLEPASAIGAFNERRVSDKPPWIQKLPLADKRVMRARLTRQHEAVRSIDEQLGDLLDAANLSKTLVIYLSDNGLMLGAHRITGKDVPYRRATEVPMYVRWDGVTSPGTIKSRVTPQIDLTALIADAARVPWTMEGHNALTTRRAGSVVEQIRMTRSYANHPAYCGWRSRRYLYVAYDTGEGREFYDYKRDPDELVNVINVRDYADRVARHRAQAKASCSPEPPGFNWH